MNQEPLPQIHLIRDTDLSVFAYELHIFAGDFLRECEFNMRSLATNTGADSIAIIRSCFPSLTGGEAIRRILGVYHCPPTRGTMVRIQTDFWGISV